MGTRAPSDRLGVVRHFRGSGASPVLRQACRKLYASARAGASACCSTDRVVTGWPDLIWI
ncbi:MAG: hypothetical protein ACJAXQ_000674 [Parvibaculaceae bacterium]|jgi:hypothetical protein